MPPIKVRLFAHPNRPNSSAAGGAQQQQGFPGYTPTAQSNSPGQGGGSGTWTPVPGAPTPSQTAGGTDKALGRFTATAYGPPWNAMNGTGVTADGTDLRPAKQIYGVAVDPKVIPLGTYLHIHPNPFNHEGTFKAFDTGGAIKGQRIDFYDWRGRQTQTAWGRKTVQVYKASDPQAKMSPPSQGGGISLPNPLNAVDEAAGAIKELALLILSPRRIADLLAKITAYWLRFLLRAIWNYAVAPIFHWHQRAALSYYEETMKQKTGFGGFVTLSFWATGYAILWAKLDRDRALVTEPQNTPLGSFVRSLGNTNARRKLVKPKDVKTKTPQKPEPVVSAARIVRVSVLGTDRKRTVKVRGNEQHRLSGGSPAGRNAEAAAEAGTDAA